MHHQRGSFRAVVVVVWPAKSAQFQSSSVTVEKHSSKRPARVCRSQSVRRTRHWPVGLFARSSFSPSLQKRTFLRARDFVRHKYSSIMAANRRWKMTVKSFNLLAAEKLQEAIFHRTSCSLRTPLEEEPRSKPGQAEVAPGFFPDQPKSVPFVRNAICQ